MHSASIIAMTLLAAQAGGEESFIERWQNHPSIIVAYVAGMRRYKVAMDEGVSAQVPQVFLDDAGIHAGTLPWTWVAANGDWLRREEEGRFRMSSGDYVGNWFTEIDCTVTEWPTLHCEDGKTRKMSVSDVNTIIFGGVQYRRALAQPQ